MYSVFSKAYGSNGRTLFEETQFNSYNEAKEYCENTLKTTKVSGVEVRIYRICCEMKTSLKIDVEEIF